MSEPPSRHLYLAGFMGTGKSAVGRLVAARLERPFHDLDEAVISNTKCSIETIFSQEGEQAFRQHEFDALQSIVGLPAAVIALGGGAPTVKEIAELVRNSGRTVLLTAGWQSIWERIRDDDSRPLLSDVLIGSDDDPAAAFERFVTRAAPLLNARLEAYGAIADCTIDTSGLSAKTVAKQVVAYANEISC